MNRSHFAKLWRAAVFAFATACDTSIDSPGSEESEVLDRPAILATRLVVSHEVVVSENLGLPTASPRADGLPFETIALQSIWADRSGFVPETSPGRGWSQVWLACLPEGAAEIESDGIDVGIEPPISTDCFHESSARRIDELPACVGSNPDEIRARGIPSQPGPCRIFESPIGSYQIPLTLETIGGRDIEFLLAAAPFPMIADDCINGFLQRRGVASECKFVHRRYKLGPMSRLGEVLHRFDLGDLAHGAEGNVGSSFAARHFRFSQLRVHVQTPQGEAFDVRLAPGGRLDIPLGAELAVTPEVAAEDLQVVPVSVDGVEASVIPGEAFGWTLEQIEAKWWRTWGQRIDVVASIEQSGSPFTEHWRASPGPGQSVIPPAEVVLLVVARDQDDGLGIAELRLRILD